MLVDFVLLSTLAAVIALRAARSLNDARVPVQVRRRG